MGKKTYDLKSGFADLLINNAIKLKGDEKTTARVQKLMADAMTQTTQIDDLTTALHALREQRATTAAQANALLDMLYEEHGAAHEAQALDMARQAFKRGEPVSNDLEQRFFVEHAEELREQEKKKTQDAIANAVDTARGKKKKAPAADEPPPES